MNEENFYDRHAVSVISLRHILVNTGIIKSESTLNVTENKFIQK
jgi:hypothetical protein